MIDQYKKDNDLYSGFEPTDDDSNPFGDIDFEKLRSVFIKSIPWIILIIIFINLLAYLFIRWTPQVFKSSSSLKLEIKNEASLLGYNNIMGDMGDGQNANTISGEIELIKSRLFINKLIDEIGLDINYYYYGSVLVSERYKWSPFSVQYTIKNTGFNDKKINLDILNDKKFLLKYEYGNEAFSKEYGFGEKIENAHFIFTITLTDNYIGEENNGGYYFTINSRRATTRYLEENIEVTPQNLSAKTISISFTDNNKHKARDLVNAIDTIYLNYTQEKKNIENKQKIDFLNKQLGQTKARLESFENFFESFTIENKTVSVDKDVSRMIEFINSIDSQRFVTQQQLTKINTLHKILSIDTVVETSNVPLFEMPREIREAIIALNEVYISNQLLLSSYKENTQAYKKKKGEIDLLKTNVTNLIQGYQKKYSADIAYFKNRKESLTKGFKKLPSKGTEYSKKKREFDLQEQFYLDLQKRKTEFEIAEAGTRPDFVILSPASLPQASIYPEKLMVYGIGAVASIILSLLFIGIGYLLHNKITSQSELEKLSSAPILGSIPYSKESDFPQSTLVINKNPKAGITEAFRSIRTNMEFLRPNKNNRVISVTSTISGEGKTFISINLGGIISMSNKKVVIVDIDMRKPNVHHAFDDDTQNFGLSTILINKSTIDECIKPTPMENMDFIAAGPKPPNPAELIMSEEFDQFLEVLKQKYDVIILDTPPVGLVTDGILVMKKVDLPIFVLRAEYSRKSFLKNINRLVKTDKFTDLSLILNAIQTSRHQGYGYGYGYGYNSRYNANYDYYGGGDSNDSTSTASIKKIFNKMKG